MLDGKAAAIQIGNKIAAGLQRDQIVVLDLTTSPLTVTDWATTRYQQQCAKVFDTYRRDVDISPDGSYFVVGTTGAYRAGSLCDPAARWETGGDTLYSVAITGTAFYVGGHQRRMNNSFAADRAGPGAVAARASPPSTRVNGLPLSWNPGRDRGVGAFAWSPPPRASGSAATPTASAATSTTAASSSCPWPAAPRSPGPGSAPSPATCSASAPTAP